jgi:hypothetical protein
MDQFNDKGRGELRVLVLRFPNKKVACRVFTCDSSCPTFRCHVRATMVDKDNKVPWVTKVIKATEHANKASIKRSFTSSREANTYCRILLPSSRYLVKCWHLPLQARIQL